MNFVALPAVFLAARMSAAQRASATRTRAPAPAVAQSSAGNGHRDGTQGRVQSLRFRPALLSDGAAWGTVG